jgi:hypothetical protein
MISVGAFFKVHWHGMHCDHRAQIEHYLQDTHHNQHPWPLYRQGMHAYFLILDLPPGVLCQVTAQNRTTMSYYAYTISHNWLSDQADSVQQILETTRKQASIGDLLLLENIQTKL